MNRNQNISYDITVKNFNNRRYDRVVHTPNNIKYMKNIQVILHNTITFIHNTTLKWIMYNSLDIQILIFILKKENNDEINSSNEYINSNNNWFIKEPNYNINNLNQKINYGPFYCVI